MGAFHNPDIRCNSAERERASCTFNSLRTVSMYITFDWYSAKSEIYRLEKVYPV